MSAPSFVGTNVMLKFCTLILVIIMTCTTKQQNISFIDSPNPIEIEEKRRQVKTEIYDEESRKYRKYLAQQEALRELERRKAHALSEAYRGSFIR